MKIDLFNILQNLKKCDKETPKCREGRDEEMDGLILLALDRRYDLGQAVG